MNDFSSYARLWRNISPSIIPLGEPHRSFDLMSFQRTCFLHGKPPPGVIFSQEGLQDRKLLIGYKDWCQTNCKYDYLVWFQGTILVIAFWSTKEAMHFRLTW